MPTSSHSSATGTTMIKLLLLLLCLLQYVTAQASNTTTTPLELECRPFGECEPCPSDALHEPFCQPFGNRRLMHCSPNRPPPSPEPIPTWYPYPTSIPSNPATQGETPAWQSCGRIPAQERADFYEFLACNLFFAAVALAVALVRSKRVEARQARRLAARIGLVRGSGIDSR
ncbi:hypothetical protein HYDPIDRAFT_113817 [Hydnomerulius pinastri MD-312]|uniref:Uncharacterized protein n=1 Tax=Hydnomerulius pinastri MD-312 TaxID=994086 RepID=A0A0C9WDP1_9AGAM|nr:hypothetical protein HYDPIDRAFT_113817 [Hydnomerulius pinastri MD-312]